MLYANQVAYHAVGADGEKEVTDDERLPTYKMRLIGEGWPHQEVRFRMGV